ncbi:hypothetical protein MRB53_026817 [Persea americana]|uniref:Uncharacterized protein n=1 Tax=Persea americana TaxID=3435 RepID=A0ACC2LJ76_PERAE|nr:hypothetical protein MRB53_026817 [Persea americana]
MRTNNPVKGPLDKFTEAQHVKLSGWEGNSLLCTFSHAKHYSRQGQAVKTKAIVFLTLLHASFRSNALSRPFLLQSPSNPNLSSEGVSGISDELCIAGFDKKSMDTNNWRPPQGEPSMDGGDWRTQLMPESRHRIVNKIMETLKRHLPISGPEGLVELRKIAVRFEEKIYAAATSQLSSCFNHSICKQQDFDAS